jgi:Flp pilus assembly protein TadG
MKFLPRRFRGSRGAELIEMAMVTPILLMIIAGIFDFGMLFRAWEVVTNAAREGARVGVLPAYTNDADVVDRVEQYMAAAGITTTCTAACPASGNICAVCIAAPTVATTAGTFTARQVTVSSQVQLPSLSVIGTFFGGSFSSIDVASTSVMRAEMQGTPPAGP